MSIGEWADAYRQTECVEFAGRSFYLVHDIKALPIDPAARDIDIVVSGHSHVAHIETRGRVLYVNLGSAGSRRFKLPVTLVTMDVTNNGVHSILHDLGEG